MSYSEVMYGFDPAKGPDETVKTSWVPLEKYQRLERALEKSRGALTYAYEDRGDLYYMNVLAEIEAILRDQK